MRRALIIGSEGQDGRLLSDRLERDSVSLLGVGRDCIRGELLQNIQPFAIDSRSDVLRLLRFWRPDEVYYLAAAHRSSQDRLSGDGPSDLDESIQVNFLGIALLLDCAREVVPEASIFYAASSFVFGNPAVAPQTELTPLNPDSLYGITKAAGVGVCRLFRASGLRVSVGFLYNHESPLRRHTYVSAKIIHGAVRIAAGSDETLVVGDLSARVDWGYAPDYVDAMVRIVRYPNGDDYVIATGMTHSVQEFAELAFSCVGLDWRNHVIEDQAIVVRRSAALVGDSSRLRERTGWEPTVSFPEMISLLIDAARDQHDR